eukprot:TRINITY_DN222_c0_g1_i1.p1 TRINITY_DN222_c0_g1~~TRINITY_DN222_c0_g1_i1.p1  ORF type:complete len:280 (+),score=40.44 TRINITY_DN222_c0_g1_i1:1433-2272(+)
MESGEGAEASRVERYRRLRSTDPGGRSAKRLSPKELMTSCCREARPGSMRARKFDKLEEQQRWPVGPVHLHETFMANVAVPLVCQTSELASSLALLRGSNWSSTPSDSSASRSVLQDLLSASAGTARPATLPPPHPIPLAVSTSAPKSETPVKTKPKRAKKQSPPQAKQRSPPVAPATPTPPKRKERKQPQPQQQLASAPAPAAALSSSPPSTASTGHFAASAYSNSPAASSLPMPVFHHVQHAPTIHHPPPAMYPPPRNTSAAQATSDLKRMLNLGGF